jgi:hypothetical protein
MRFRRPHVAALAEVAITREHDTAIIAYHESGVATTHFELGTQIQQMTDQQILDVFNETLRVRDAHMASCHHVAVEIPPGEPQIEYSSMSDQWTPRGDVLRCVIAGDGLDGKDFVYVDDRTLTLAQFGKLLGTYAGWGMRVIFVPDDRTEETPETEVRLPE